MPAIALPPEPRDLTRRYRVEILWLLFAVANYRVADFAEAFAEVMYNDTHSGFQIAALPCFF